MRDLLAPANRRVLVEWARRDPLVAFDYDGTLAPISSDAERAVMRPGTRRLLATLTRRYRCAVISGRALRDLRPLVAGLPFRVLVGNHGAELGRARRSPLVRRWRAALRPLEGLDGVTIEDKDVSLSVHYRAARRRAAARRAILEAVAGLPRARVIGGKCVVNLVPEGAPDKGGALARVAADLGCAAAVYVGDDETDEDVFGLRGGPDLLAVRVGARRGSRAAFYVPRQGDVDRLLERLIRIRDEMA